MSTIRKTITLTNTQDEWVKAQIAKVDYNNDSEYFRDLVQRDQEENAKFKLLKQAIQEGWDGGVSDRTVPEIMATVEARLRTNGQLQPCQEGGR